MCRISRPDCDDFSGIDDDDTFYLVVPAASLAAGASVTLEVDLLTPLTLGKYATLSLRVLRGGMP